jgi:hypothetical protein
MERAAFVTGPAPVAPIPTSTRSAPLEVVRLKKN